MPSIIEAKKHLRDLYRHEQGFVGVGIGRANGEDCLRVYVVDPTFPVARQLAGQGRFEGYPVEVEVSGEVRALRP